jgi:hypothetical protein
MATYRALALDAVTGTPVAELPLAGLSYDSMLNGAGECSATLPFPPLDTARGRELARIFNDAATEVRRQLVIERDGVPVWAGMIWASPYADDQPARDIRAAEWWAYFRRRAIIVTRRFVQVDQLEIARTLIGDALAVSTLAGGDMDFTVGTETSGVLRDRTYEAVERKEVGEAVEQLAEVTNGFDFAVDVRWGTTGDLDKIIRLQYPRRGRPFTQTGLTFEVGRNVSDFTWPSDGTRYANVVHLLGAGDGARALRSTRLATGEIFPPSDSGLGMPIVEDVVSRTDVIRASTLASMADSTLASRARPVVVPEITVRADADPIFGSYVTGDSCRVLIQPGVSPRFPQGLDVLRRIVGWQVNVSDEGAETVRVTLGEDFGG